MSLGTLLRASTLLVLVWLVLLGPRAWPLLAAARDAGSLPRAALLVSSHGCERHDVDDLLWRCEAKGTLRGGPEFHGRQAALALEVRGEEPGTRYEPGTSADVVIVPEPFGGGLRLFEADRVAHRARAELEWLAVQPLLSLGALFAAWLALWLLESYQRRATKGALELTTWPGLPALALGLIGLAVALGAGWMRAVPVSIGLNWLLLVLVPIAPALVRLIVIVDRPARHLRHGAVAGPWRAVDPPVPISGVVELRLREAPHVQGIPAWAQWRLEMAALDATRDLVTGSPRRVRRLGAALAAYLGVPLLHPADPSILPRLDTFREPEAVDLESAEDVGAGLEDEGPFEAPAEPAPPAELPTSGPHGRHASTPGERLQRLARGVLGVTVIFTLALGAAIVSAGGIDPFTARLLEPEVESWPAGRLIRRAAVAVVSMRGRDARAVALLVRLAHTLPPEHPLWVPAMEAAGRLVGEPLTVGDPPAALARLDEAAARVLGRPIGPLGVLGWWDLHEYWVMWLDDLGGADEALAVARFNGLRPPEGLPTSESFLVNVGRALVDRRPTPFAVVVEEAGGVQRPLAVERSAAAGRRALDVTTVGEALAILLATYPEHRPESLPDDVARWWAPVAKARGLPAVGGATD